MATEASFAAAGAQVGAYGAIIVGERKSREVEPFRWINISIANVKTTMRGSYHPINASEHRHRWPAEAQYRINRRFYLAPLVGSLVQACAHTLLVPKNGCDEQRYRVAES